MEHLILRRAHVFQCVVNVSEGRDEHVLGELAAAAGTTLLDLHRDADHNRSVLTLAGPADAVVPGARALATVAVDRLDLRTHEGAHPRLGVLDVVPFVPYARAHPPRRTSPQRWCSPTTSPAGWVPASVCRASSTGPWPAAGPGPCPTSAATPSGGRDPVTRAYVRRGAGAGGPAHGRDGGRRPAGARGLQPVGLLGRGRPSGRPAGARAPTSAPRPDGRDPGPGVVQPDRPRAPSARPALDDVAALVAEAGGAVEGAELWALSPARTRGHPRVLASSGSRSGRRWSPAWRAAPTTDRGDVAGAPATSRRARARAGADHDADARSCRPRWPNSAVGQRVLGQSSRTTRPRQTSLASRVDARARGRTGQGRRPCQFACSCQLRSWRP